MDKQAILDRLRANESALKARGVAHAALFGSRTRGDNRLDSDKDIMIELDPEAVVTVYDYDFIAALFEGPWTSGTARGSNLGSLPLQALMLCTRF